MERIVIKNFGPIKDVDLEINDFMVFIGPQASGKSTIAKLIFFYKNLQSEFRRFLFERIVNTAIRKTSEKYERNSALFCIELYFTDIFSEIRIYKNSKVEFYFAEDFIIRIEINEKGEFIGELPIHFSNDLDVTLKKSKEIFDKGKDDVFSTRDHISFLIESFLVEKFNKNFSQNLYIPAGRGFISTISNQIFNLKTENLDYFIKEFASTISFIQSNISLEESDIKYDSLELTEKYKSIYNLLKSRQNNILKGKYLYNEESNTTGIEIENKDFIPLDKASSGQQESVWVVQYLLSKIHQLSTRSSFTVIEEPEAHLYPEAQKSITELIVLLVNLLSNQAVITTHSPYILAVINNLLYANKIGKYKEDVSDVVDKNLWLDFNRVGAYFVGGENNEGRITRIMDDKLEMIQSQYLDNASEIINKEFDEIYKLED